MNIPVSAYDLYIGSLLTDPTHFHTQCMCRSCTFRFYNEKEYTMLINPKLSHRNKESIVLSHIKTVDVKVGLDYPKIVRYTTTTGHLTVNDMLNIKREIKRVCPDFEMGGYNQCCATVKRTNFHIFIRFHEQ